MGLCRDLAALGWSKMAGSWRASARMTSTESAIRKEGGPHFVECATDSSGLREWTGAARPIFPLLRGPAPRRPERVPPVRPKPYDEAQGRCPAACVRLRPRESDLGT